MTGYTADEWATADSTRLRLQLPAAVPCPNIVKLFADRQPTGAQVKPRLAAVSRPPGPAGGVQLIGCSSEIAALASFHEMQKKYWSVLGSRPPLVIRSPAGRNAFRYRVRIGADTRREATKLCSRLRTVGGSYPALKEIYFCYVSGDGLVYFDQNK